MTHSRCLRMSKLTLGLVAALAAAPAFAQSTSSGVGGQVTSAAGAPVVGAEVTITHTESGTVSRATTDASGRYNARGLRVGGPYTITINKPGEGTRTEEGVYLGVNQIGTVNAALTGDLAATNLEAVQVTAVAAGSEVFSATKMGSGTSISQETIEAMPSVGGNIQDMMRLDPRVAFVDRASGSISAGGQNPRYNAVRIDGVSASDTFGLEGNSFPTRRQPVSMEAIEAINVDLSSYDITITGATGAVVDAVTKSGTNEFHGSVYGYMRDGSWFGDNPGGGKFNGFEDEKTYGFTLGGPLVKDKLFFFANYEKFEQSAPGADIAGSAIGAGTITDAQIAQAQQIFQDRYGVSAGTYDAASDTNLEEYALKLDWNITDNQRASFRYSKLEQDKLRINGYGQTTGASISSYWYQHDKKIESYVGQLFSDWSDNFSTEIKASYRDYSAIRTPSAPGTPAILIGFGGLNSNRESVANPTLYLGTEANTQYNELYTKTWNYFASGTLTLGDHDVKFGADYSKNEIYNLYAPNVDGYLIYNGIEGFRNNTPVVSTWRNPVDGGVESLAADYDYTTLGLFVQDTWYVNNNLTLTLGVRADKYDTNKDTAYNQRASEFFGYDNRSIGDNGFLVQPRVGFNYTFDSDRPTQLRGGVGLFRGEAPQVWLGNIYANNGVNFTQGTDYPYNNRNRPAQQVVNFVSDDFRTPSVYKANLAFDHELPWNGLVASAELLVTKVKDGLYFKRLELVQPSFTGGPDGRNFYWGNVATASTSKATTPSWVSDAVLLDNTDKGRTAQFTVSLAKPFSPDSDWAWNLGYTYTDAKEVASNSSSVATSNWNNNYIFQANENALSRSRYEIRNRISGSVNWKHAFFGDYETQVGMFYEGRTGRPYSFVYSNDMNGDGRTYNDLFYVPKGRGDVLFTGGAAMEDAFFAWMENNAQLNRYAGQVTPQNSARAGWVNTFDVRITQQLPGFMKGHKSEIWLDIQNVGNLLNKKWGRIDDFGFYADQGIANFRGIDPTTGKYLYEFRAQRQGTQSATVTDSAFANADADGFNTGVSQWSLQLGFRYKF